MAHYIYGYKCLVSEVIEATSLPRIVYGTANKLVRSPIICAAPGFERTLGRPRSNMRKNTLICEKGLITYIYIHQNN